MHPIYSLIIGVCKAVRNRTMLRSISKAHISRAIRISRIISINRTIHINKTINISKTTNISKTIHIKRIISISKAAMTTIISRNMRTAILYSPFTPQNG
ncbi:MAG: hypothetical protein K2K09_07405 [Lachnospiraceae bacterium]|nr:hypothetical protein [Lachnospiraceae bacterium]